MSRAALFALAVAAWVVGLTIEGDLPTKQPDLFAEDWRLLED